MFGYVTINKPELKIRDYERYHAYYCGLCHRLKARYGRTGQMTLSYDMTFLVILLTSLYESEITSEKHKCIVHPSKRHSMFMNEITDYCSDMNIALAYYHFADDWQDEKKISGLMGEKAFRKKRKQIEEKYPRQCQSIQKGMSMLSDFESHNSQNPEKVSKAFGYLLGEIMLYYQDAFSGTLRELGSALGEYIYLMDAYMDLSEDQKKNCYNPLCEWSQEADYEDKIKNLLIEQITRATIALEKLPLELDVCILRNILYEGVWTKYERKQKHDK